MEKPFELLDLLKQQCNPLGRRVMLEDDKANPKQLLPDVWTRAFEE